MSTLFNNFVELFYTTCYYLLTQYHKEALPMLDLYKNIKERRLALKMSQDTLAELTGYKDRSSIAKIEKGDVDISESKIRDFAKALKTTPQELMGWDEPEKTTTIAAHFDGDEYTPEELDEIKAFAEFVKSKRK
jgi:transcriptional regulator with XRE-family HTH domain